MLFEDVRQCRLLNTTPNRGKKGCLLLLLHCSSAEMEDHSNDKCRRRGRSLLSHLRALSPLPILSASLYLKWLYWQRMPNTSSDDTEERKSFQWGISIQNAVRSRTHLNPCLGNPSCIYFCSLRTHIYI